MFELNRNFYFARHGQTDWNVAQKCQGQLDIPLNEEGRREAHLLGEKCRDLKIKFLFTSPLSRAHETAEIVASYLPSVKVVVVEEWKERSWGLLEGISSQEMYHAEELELSNNDYIIQNKVETREELKIRIAKALAICSSMAEEYLVISHGRLYFVLCELLKIPPNKQILNTELIRCCYSIT